MKLREFLINCDDFCNDIEVRTPTWIGSGTLFSGSITAYLNLPEAPNGTIKSWDVYVENNDYPIMKFYIDVE